MRERITIDLNEPQSPINAGRIGEHNAQTLVITPPDELGTEADSYGRVVFDIGMGTIYSEPQYTSPFEISLNQQLTQVSPMQMWCEAYAVDGTYIGKSLAATLVFSGPRESGEPINADNDAHGMALEVATNTADITALKEFTAKFGEDENGKLTYNGEVVCAEEQPT